MRDKKFPRKPQMLTFMERAPGSDASPVKKMGSLEKVYLYQHCPSSVENLARRGRLGTGATAGRPAATATGTRGGAQTWATARPGGASPAPPAAARGPPQPPAAPQHALDDVDGLAGVLDGHDEAARVEDGVVVGPLQHPRPRVAPVVRDVDVGAHHRDGPPHAPCQTGAA